ncbi:MAG: tetratricopeptide repeat protein [Candidatus Acidiferrales bacterium]
MSAQAEAIPVTHTAAPPTGPWIYRPWLDLLVGCGAWSAPLLAIALWIKPTQGHGWAVSFYLLALIFNYPHFMATVYRAYRTREDFEKYKFFTLHLTLLLVFTGAVVHISPSLLPWLFTLYICWSPWHYSGQNYGLMMMFARRGGATIAPLERRWLHAAFIASYVMLLASFETGGFSDPLILSLGLPLTFTLPARFVLGGIFVSCAFFGFERLVRQHGVRAMAAPLTLVLTQFLWFVLPTILELNSAYHVPQTRYSSGILAVMHSAQYLWITSYYQGREARAAGQSRWRMAGYFLTLIAGGIALFIPGPWLVSKIFRFDFTTSFLIFTAIVNIHHFMLDGALWKLRDSRVSSLLINRDAKTRAGRNATGLKPAASSPSLGRRMFARPAVRMSLLGVLFLWGGMDQIHFALGTNPANLSSLLRAARMEPYDSALQGRIALAEEKAGRQKEAVEAWKRAVSMNPENLGLQHSYARALIQEGRYSEAYERYGEILKMFPRDSDALINYGLLAARMGNAEVAMDAWQRAVDADPTQRNAHLYLAEGLDKRSNPAAAVRHWEAFLRLSSLSAHDSAISSEEMISAAIQLADDDASINRNDAALSAYHMGITLSQRTNDVKLESIALSHLADLQDRTGDARSAATSYQQGLALDAKANDSQGAAIDWFNYGQFLRRHPVPADLAYACLLHAEDLLASEGGQKLKTVRDTRKQMETDLGKKETAAVRKTLPELLSRVSALPPTSF